MLHWKTIIGNAMGMRERKKKKERVRNGQGVVFKKEIDHTLGVAG